MMIAGCVNREQREFIDYLKRENEVLREMLGDRRLPTTSSSFSLRFRSRDVYFVRRLGYVGRDRRDDRRASGDGDLYAAP